MSQAGDAFEITLGLSSESRFYVRLSTVTFTVSIREGADADADFAFVALMPPCIGKRWLRRSRPRMYTPARDDVSSHSFKAVGGVPPSGHDNHRTHHIARHSRVEKHIPGGVELCDELCDTNQLQLSTTHTPQSAPFQ